MRRGRERLGRRSVATALAIAVVGLGGFSAVDAAAAAGSASGSTPAEWVGFLGGSLHQSTAADTVITRGEINSLKPHWRWKLPAVAGRSRIIWSTPATWRGTIYAAGDTGMLYALNSTNASVRWQRDFGVQAKRECKDAQGFVGSPAVRADASGHPFVYVNAPDGYLYELDGTTGKTVWRSVVMIPSTKINNTFPWSSPTLANGKVYIGISSNCDNPFVRGGLKSYDGVTGHPIASAWTIPAGFAGAGVWTSVAADASAVYVTTASVTTLTQNAHPPTVANDFDQYSIVKFNPNTLARTGKWVAPTTTTFDPDFASSPILFTAVVGGKNRQLVGACRKDGNFYAVRTDTMQLVWSRNVMLGTPGGQTNCLGGGTWDGARLFLSGGFTKIGGVDYYGSVREVNPATGAIVWERGLPAAPIGAGTYNRNGILAYATADWAGSTGDGLYLLDPGTGAVLRVLHDTVAWPEFAQPIWAEGQLFQVDFDAITDWRP